MAIKQPPLEPPKPYKFNGTVLEKWRIRWCWTHAEAAKACGISVGYWHAIVTGKNNPTVNVFYRIVSAFGMHRTMAELERFNGK